jgi:hypothetical protein
MTLIVALVIGLIFTLLTYAQTNGRWPACLLAGFSAAGATVLGMKHWVAACLVTKGRANQRHPAPPSIKHSGRLALRLVGRSPYLASR